MLINNDFNRYYRFSFILIECAHISARHDDGQWRWYRERWIQRRNGYQKWIWNVVRCKCRRWGAINLQVVCHHYQLFSPIFFCLGGITSPGIGGNVVTSESEYTRERYPGSEFNGERFYNRGNFGYIPRYFKRKWIWL